MFKHFIALQWKSFFRSASVGKSIGLKILMGFLALYFILVFLSLGFGLFPLLQKAFPDDDPLITVNSYILYWFSMELLVRFFMQSLPVMDVKPLLTLPVKKRKVVHYVLMKSLFSFFNLLPLLVILPFGFSCVYLGKHDPVEMTGWMLTMVFIMLGVNFMNFIIKTKFSDDIRGFMPFILAMGIIAGLDYFNIFKFTDLSASVFGIVKEYPLSFLIPLLVAVGTYLWNLKYLMDRFYLDSGLRSRSKEATTTDMGWTRHFGDIAPFLQQDLKLIWRNKRPKSTVWIALIMLGYGFFFYPNETYHNEMPGFFVFVGIFITGIFMISFGQFIPAWDSNYYSMIMAQNIPLRKYLASKAGLMTFSVIVLFLLSTPYVYFGWDILALNFACALYNIGVNVPVLLFAGSFNRKRMDLEKGQFMNYQGTGATQWLVGLPLMLLPLLIWYFLYKLFSFNIASLAIFLLGIIGILLRGVLMERITRLYRKNKYAMIHGFKQQA